MSFLAKYTTSHVQNISSSLVHLKIVIEQHRATCAKDIKEVGFHRLVDVSSPLQASRMKMMLSFKEGFSLPSTISAIIHKHFKSINYAASCTRTRIQLRCSDVDIKLPHSFSLHIVASPVQSIIASLVQASLTSVRN